MKAFIQQHRNLVMLLVASTAVRTILAAVVELGNDEAYYWTYALFPDWSHFDHPPMVGYAIQLFSLNLLWSSELALRLPAILSGTLSTWLIYRLGAQMHNQRTGWYAALLFTASLYGSVISGLFIMPDGPLVPCWLWGLLLLHRALVGEGQGRPLLLAGLAIGLAVLSKYHAVFLWIGAAWIILRWRRDLLRQPALYLGLGLTALLVLPIFGWNVDHDWISFRFQGERVGFFDKGLRVDYFFSELLGQVFYNNPVNVTLIMLALIGAWKGAGSLSAANKRFVYAMSLPLIATILFFALFRRTLPHWTGPSYLALLVLAAAYLSERTRKTRLIWVRSAVGMVLLVLVAGAFEVNLGLITAATSKPPSRMEKLGKRDVTLDMYGWEQLAGRFQKIMEEDEAAGALSPNAPIISQRWYNAAHLDYYVAHPMGKPLVAFGSLKSIHKYAWINRERGLPAFNSDAYFIAPSRSYKHEQLLAPYFREIVPRDTLPIVRNGHTAGYFFVFHLKGYNGGFADPLQ